MEFLPDNFFETIRHFLNIPTALIAGYLFFKIHRFAKKTSHKNAAILAELIGWGGMMLAGMLFVYRAVQGFLEWI